MTRRRGTSGGGKREKLREGELHIVGGAETGGEAQSTAAADTEQQQLAPVVQAERWLPVTTERAIVKTEQAVLVDAVEAMNRPVFVQLEGQQADDIIRRRRIGVVRPGNTAELFPADEKGVSSVIAADLGSLVGVRLIVQDERDGRLEVPMTLTPLGPDEVVPKDLAQVNLPHCTPIGPSA